METEHILTKLENELTSILIEIFKNHGWTLEKLPPIYDSEEEPIGEWDFEKFLGQYRPTNESWCQIGEVILYPKNIKKVAKKFYEFDQFLKDPRTGNYIYKENGEISKKSDLLHFITQSGTNPDFGVNIEDAINYLSAIVLIHELTHWIIHWNTDFNGKSLKCVLKYNTADEKKFHESIAQYFTDLTLKTYGNKKMNELFTFLKDKQSESYQVFIELKTDLDGNPINVACVFTALGICWKEDFSQSFNNLKNYNYLSVLYLPNDHIISYNEISAPKPAIDQDRIERWFKTQSKDIVIFLYDYFSEKNKEKYRSRYVGIKLGH